MCAYLTYVFRAELAGDPSAVVLHDTGVYWDIKELRHHSPDVTVIRGVQEQRDNWSSFDVAEQGVRPSLLIEVVSPNTRETDVVTKVKHYFRAKVPVYVIVDRETEEGPLRLIGYLRGSRRYLPMPADDDGRLWLDAVGLSIGIKDNRVVCYRPDSDEPIGDYTAVSQALVEVRERAAAAKARADAEQARADAAEARMKEMEAELARLRQERSGPQ
jgi:hypothetical protein